MSLGSAARDRVTNFAREGFVLCPEVFTAGELEALRAAAGMLPAPGPGGMSPGVRDILRSVPGFNALARGPELAALLTPLLGPGAVPVRAIFFNKCPGANWRVPWHQDLSIAVRARVEDAPGFGPWSVKAGVWHVQPPADLLAGLVTARIHLDDTDADNGALRVLPGSHAVGRLGAGGIARWRQEVPEETCVLPAGGVLLMRPLLLHASAPARVERPRRVVHIEFAAAGSPLPAGLEWHG